MIPAARLPEQCILVGRAGEHQGWPGHGVVKNVCPSGSDFELFDLALPGRIGAPVGDRCNGSPLAAPDQQNNTAQIAASPATANAITVSGVPWKTKVLAAPPRNISPTISHTTDSARSRLDAGCTSCPFVLRFRPYVVRARAAGRIGAPVGGRRSQRTAGFRQDLTIAEPGIGEADAGSIDGCGGHLRKASKSAISSLPKAITRLFEFEPDVIALLLV
jgi:hypothetical protein